MPVTTADALLNLYNRLLALPSGMIVPGNVNLHDRPIAAMPGGERATVYSGTFPLKDGTFVLLPQVVEGRVVSPRKAFTYYRQTGQHLGIFESEEAADQYAQQLHEQQAVEYGPAKPGPR